MSSNFLEINNATFIASDNNKVKNVSLKIKKNLVNKAFFRVFFNVNCLISSNFSL